MKRTAIILVAMAAAVVPSAALAQPLPPPPHPCQYVFAGVTHCHRA